MPWLRLEEWGNLDRAGNAKGLPLLTHTHARMALWLVTNFGYKSLRFSRLDLCSYEFSIPLSRSGFHSFTGTELCFLLLIRTMPALAFAAITSPQVVLSRKNEESLFVVIKFIGCKARVAVDHLTVYRLFS